MTEFISKLKKKKFFREKKSFEVRYNHCNRCEEHLNVLNDEETVCDLCGETFCKSCIAKHQKYCYN